MAKSDAPTAEVPKKYGAALFGLMALLGVATTSVRVLDGSLNIQTFPILAAGGLIGAGIIGMGWMLDDR